MDFLPKNDQIWPKICVFGQLGPGHAGLFGALLLGRLVVVARGLYLARHLFTLFISSISHLTYNLVVDEENEKEQEENPESQVQLLKQVFRQNFHFGVEVCSPFSNLCLPAQKLKPPLFLTTHVTTLFFCRKFCPKHLRACGKFCNETRRASV